jgi:hypothetical protein
VSGCAVSGWRSERLRQCPHPVHRSGQRELSGAQALHEVAAAAVPGLLHRAQHRIQRAESAGHPLCRHCAPDDDAVPVEQRPGERVQPPRLVGLAGRQQRPAAADRRRPAAGRDRAAAQRPSPGRPSPAGPARPGATPACRGAPVARRLVRRRARCSRRGRADALSAGAEQGAQRRQRVVGQPASPDQIPDRGATARSPGPRSPARRPAVAELLTRPEPLTVPAGRLR